MAAQYPEGAGWAQEAAWHSPGTSLQPAKQPQPAALQRKKPPSDLSAPPISATRHPPMSPCHELLLTGQFLTHRYSQQQVFAPQDDTPCLIFLMAQRKCLNPWG